jgi:protein TonB
MRGLLARHNLAGGFSAVAGTAVILSVVIGINEFADRNEYDDRPTASEIDVATTPDQPDPVPEPEPQPEPEPTEAPPPPPMAELDSAIGGVDIPVPGLDANEIDPSAGEGEGDGDLVMTDETVDQAPQPAAQLDLEYPSGAKREGVEGHVTVSLLIDDQGGVQRVRVLEARPEGVFEEAATRAARNWAFEPARYQGEAVKVWARQKIRFELD